MRFRLDTAVQQIPAGRLNVRKLQRTSAANRKAQLEPGQAGLHFAPDGRAGNSQYLDTLNNTLALPIPENIRFLPSRL